VQRFPDVPTLAAAPLEAVLEAWSGLGYYRRARLLHQAAQQVVREHHGDLPTAPDAVLALPGIGRYTAGAILSIALNQPEPIVDGNVERVFARWLAIPEDVKSGAVQKRLWELATTWVRDGASAGESPREVNQALMELGATLCTPRQPACEVCPVRPFCAAYQAGEVTHYPVLPARKMPRDRRYFFVLLRDKTGRLLLRQRPEGDRSSLLPSGLWELPHAEWPLAEASPPLAVLQQILGCELLLVGEPYRRRHSILDWRLELIVQGAQALQPLTLPDHTWRWWLPARATQAAQASATRKLLDVAV
jgi:A/G-specific adenine glycosylase